MHRWHTLSNANRHPLHQLRHPATTSSSPTTTTATKKKKRKKIQFRFVPRPLRHGPTPHPNNLTLILHYLFKHFPTSTSSTSSSTRADGLQNVRWFRHPNLHRPYRPTLDPNSFPNSQAQHPNSRTSASRQPRRLE